MQEKIGNTVWDSEKLKYGNIAYEHQERADKLAEKMNEGISPYFWYVNKVSKELPEYKTYEELYKALEDEGTVRSIMENDKEIEFKFHARKLEYIASFLKPATAGSDISPFSTKNLPKCDYPIPEEDLAEYNAILDSMDNKDYLLVSRVTDAFLTNKLQKSKQYRTIDLKKDMKKKCLKTKEYIHSLGEWDKYIEYLKKEICK